MSEKPNEEVPADLIPLGLVHNDERREDLMSAVDVAQKRGAITLWAYKGHHSARLQQVPDTYELIWMGGPGRGEADHPDYPGLVYYCDVTAVPRLRANKPGAYFLHAGAADAEVFTQVLISKAVLTQLQTAPPARQVDGEQLSRREKHSQQKQEMYKTWFQLALKYGHTDDGLKRTREIIADKVASDPDAKDPLTGASPKGSTVKRRLDKDCPGWAEKSWAEKTGRNSCPR
jgi:hypothetical protein